MFIPVSTYRVQLHDQFTFRQLQDILGYLHELGVSTIYASPITTAFKGSMHGYDVTDPLNLNPAIGTEKQLQQIAATLGEYGMSWLQDIVPNHMAYSSSNPWLYDALERGRDSKYYGYFDIITDHPIGLMGERLMAPFLGSTLTECLKKGELKLDYVPTGFIIRYFDKEYPVAVRCYRWIGMVAGDDPPREGRPPGYPPTIPAILEKLERALPADPAEWKATKTDCLRQLADDPEWEDFVAARVAFFNERTDLLETLLQDQPYLLTHYPLASRCINYRRFFTINSLICLRMEQPAVFDAYHTALDRWWREGWIQGLRIDHIDGLAAPKAYLRDIRRLFGDECYVVAEKILTAGEAMPPDWPLQGSTGYDFLATVSQLLTDAGGSRELLDYYCSQVIALPPYPTLVYERKLAFLWQYMVGELDNLLYLLLHLPLLYADSQDRDRLRQALAVWMASFPAYRAYPDEAGGSPADPELYAAASAKALERRSDLDTELRFLAGLCDYTGEDVDRETAEQRLRFLSRLMQFTSPLAAKGIEDTSFYIYNAYIAHCEVGDSPGTAGIQPEEFHRRMEDRQLHQRHSLNATTTHDTKRAEDNRIRLNMLSAMPREWINAVSRWRALNHAQTTRLKDRPAPSANDEYLIYQALLGAFPMDGVVTDEFRERFDGYLIKALREAKTETNHEEPDQEYEKQCSAFAAALLQTDSPFLRDFGPFALDVINRSVPYCLAQVLLKLTCPGVPDIYQGAELWDTSLVDPDNRRPVDFALRSQLLREIEIAARQSLDTLFTVFRSRRNEGAEKLFTLTRALQCRNRLPRVFAEGAYIPVAVEGPWLSFLRNAGNDWILVVVPLVRLGVSLTATLAPQLPEPATLMLRLPDRAPARWMDVFTGAIVTSDDRSLVWPDGPQWPVLLLTGHDNG
jgi:(1->4)-alpha-D-glucan 1-alpha-D-glucosylmutase